MTAWVALAGIGAWLTDKLTGRFCAYRLARKRISAAKGATNAS